MLANMTDYGARVESGKNVEHRIVNALRQRGHQIIDPTPHEDMIDKIDGWWVSKKNNKKFSFQIKFRESGNDILFELVANIFNKIAGRDLKSKATLYIVSNPNGITKMFLTEPIKKKAYEILDIIDRDIDTKSGNRTWQGGGWEAKVQTDRASGEHKIVAYFNPNLFSAIATWNLSL